MVQDTKSTKLKASLPTSYDPQNYQTLRDLGFPGETFPQMLAQRAKEMPNQTYMRRKRYGIWKSFTWYEVYEHVRRFACGMWQLGLRPGEVAGIIGENEQQMYWAEFGIQALGAVPVVMYPDALPSDIQFVVDDSCATFLVCEDQEQVDKALEIKDQLPGVRRVIYWDSRCMWQYDDSWLMSFDAVEELGSEEAAQVEFEKLLWKGTAEDICVISYTSGTTGKPKGLLVNYRNMVDAALRFSEPTGLKPGAQYLSYIPPAWSTEQAVGFATGLVAPLVVNFAEEPETVMSDLREIGSEMVFLSPRQWENLASSVEARILQCGRIRQRWYRWAIRLGERVARHKIEGEKVPVWLWMPYWFARFTMLDPIRDRLGLSKTYLAISGGSALSPAGFRLFHGMGVMLRNLYGLSEMGFISMHVGTKFDPETVGAWLEVRPGLAPPLEHKIDEDQQLLVRGGTGFIGYLNRPEENQKKLNDEGWFLTGDAVNLRKDGQVVYLDRVDDLRELSTGSKFPPQFVETRLRFSPFIRDFLSLGDVTRPFVAGLIDIDFETVGEWATTQRISYTTHADLSQKPEVVELVGKEVNHFNENLPEEMRVRRFTIFPKPLDPDEGELTRTGKLRREFLEKKYEDLINALYEGDENFSLEVPVKYRDGRTGTVRTFIRFGECT